jgi:hypothetical protein
LPEIIVSLCVNRWKSTGNRVGGCTLGRTYLNSGVVGFSSHSFSWRNPVDLPNESTDDDDDSNVCYSGSTDDNSGSNDDDSCCTNDLGSTDDEN